MGRVDHQYIRLACFFHQRGEYLVEYTQLAPAHKTAVKRLILKSID
jgi:hypothetical protein